MSKYAARNRRIYVHVTEAEEALLLARAKSGGYSFLGAYVRDVALGGPVKVIYRDASFDDFVGEFKRFRREIHGIIAAVGAGHEDVEHSLKIEFERILQMAIKIYELCMSR